MSRGSRIFTHAARMAALAIAISGIAASPAFDPKPWLEDLDQVQHAFTTKYANLEWAVSVREADLPSLFADTARRIRGATSDADARAAFDRIARRLGDGHVEFDWKHEEDLQSSGETRPKTCVALGYDSRKLAAPLAAHATGYHAIVSVGAGEFSAGILERAPHKIGILKIGMFAPEGSPALCEAALQALSIPKDARCDDACSDRISAWAHNRLTVDLAAQLRALKDAGAETLVIDIAGNGGGSEWAEAAARMLTATRLKSERIAFVRGDHWAKTFADDEAALIKAARASPTDRALLLGLARKVKSKRKLADTTCDGDPIFHSVPTRCHWLIEGFYASGLLDSADPAVLRGKPFANLLFTPMEFPFEEGVWNGPLIVLVDRDTYSAAEEFAAVLQDNHAAIILGEPTGGAGCGHTNGGTPEILRNSGATLELPDCVRLRADGSDEIMGVEPDVLVGFTPRDGANLKGGRFEAKLDDALALAFRQHR